MTFTRLRHLVATIALILFVPGGGSAALAEPEAVTDRAGGAAEPDHTTPAPQYQRRVEAAWLGEQVRAGARARVDHQRPRWTTSSNARRAGLRIGRNDRSAG
jgi:hypothetical protein